MDWTVLNAATEYPGGKYDYFNTYRFKKNNNIAAFLLDSDILNLEIQDLKV